MNERLRRLDLSKVGSAVAIVAFTTFGGAAVRNSETVFAAAESRPSVRVVEPPGTPIPQTGPDSGDNRHPSGKDRSIEPGKSGTQGKSKSDPDGPLNGGPDKPGYKGGIDTGDQDGNNGCGNDDDFEDDNRGNCKGKPVHITVTSTATRKPTHTPKPTGTPKPTETPRRTNTPVPTSEPTKTSTPEPTSTAKPTDTPKPTETPRRTNTPVPTSEPTYTVTSTPISTATPFVTRLPRAGEFVESVKESVIAQARAEILSGRENVLLAEQSFAPRSIAGIDSRLLVAGAGLTALGLYLRRKNRK